MAQRIAEAARQAIRSHDWTSLTGRLNVTFSVGVATAFGTTTQSALLGQADRNLYLAKRNGRDQLVTDETGGSVGTGESVAERGAPVEHRPTGPRPL